MNMKADHIDDYGNAMYECPGHAHELDNTFNPATQSAYGPGYHMCSVCCNENYVTLSVYKTEIAHQKYLKAKQKYQSELDDQEETLNKLKDGPKMEYDKP